MKFWAKVILKSEKNAEYLIRAFFKEFNSESSIVIRGKETKVEIIFNNKPPEEIIEAISHCEIIEFNYGKALGEYSEDEQVQEEILKETEQDVVEEEILEKTKQDVVEEEVLEETEQDVVEEEASEQTEQVVAEKEILQQPEQPKSKTKKEKPTKVVNAETVNVPQLEEIAKKAISFEHFVKLVAEWMEMDKRQELFENLVIVATEVEKLSWKDLEKALKNKKIFYTQWDKAWVSQQVSEKLNEYSVTMLPLLNLMKEYKNYSFVAEHCDENFTEVATEKNVLEEEVFDKKEEITPKNKVKMECMPEIPFFEETLGSVDKTQPIENRLKYVLNAMGLDKKNQQEKQQIFEIANTAVRLERMAFDIIILRANIPMEYWTKARMTFSKFINDFVSEYDSDMKVKLLDFLKQLQEIVMYESEIESFNDFVN